MAISALLISCGIGAIAAVCWRIPASTDARDKAVELHIGVLFASVAASCFALLATWAIAANDAVDLRDILLGDFDFSQPHKFVYFACGLITMSALLGLRLAKQRAGLRKPQP